MRWGTRPTDGCGASTRARPGSLRSTNWTSSLCACAVGLGGIWVTDQVGDAVVRLDPAGRVVALIDVPPGASGVAVGGGSVWVASYLDRSVSEIDPGTNRIVRSIHVRESPRDLTFRNGAVWVIGDAS